MSKKQKIESQYTELVATNLKPETKKEFLEMCKQRHLSVSALLRELIVQALESQAAGSRIPFDPFEEYTR